jgi:lipoate---protein ligase
MADTWRVLDTGLRAAAQNIALDRALLEARRAEEITSTLRFQRFTSCALVGCNQSIEQELDLDHCRKAGIDVQRRLTGGDVMCLDEAQLVWSLFLHRRDIGPLNMQAVSRRLCHAAAAAVSALGVSASFRAPNQIEVEGRMVSDSAGIFDGDALLFQGTLLIDCDPAALLRASRLSIPAPGFAQDRIASLKALLGARPDAGLVRRYLTEAFESEFSVEFREGDLMLSENERYRVALREIAHPDWVNLVARPAAGVAVLQARQPDPHGPLRATVAFDRESRIIRQVWFSCDVPVAPRRTLADLEAALLYTPAARLVNRVERFFAGRQVEMPPLTAEDFIAVVRRAIGALTAAIDEKNETG